MTRTQGLTLLELLIVCAVIGILSAVGIVTFRNAIERARVNEAATQVSADLQRARSASQRFNRGSTFQVAAANDKSYTLTVNGQSTVKTLPAGAKFTAANTIGYSAPFGETGASIITLEVSSASGTKRSVKVLGVTGKVYLQ